MRNVFFWGAGLVVMLILGMAWGQNRAEIRLTALEFGADGMLYAADAAGGRVIAVDLEEKKGEARPTRMDDLGGKLARALGGNAAQVMVYDVAVHPKSHAVFVLAGTRAARPRGGMLFAGDPNTSRLFRVETDGSLKEVDLDGGKMKSVSLPDGVLPLDVAVSGKQLIVSSMPNAGAFQARLHAANLPLKGGETDTVETEIYHGTHRRWETQAPLNAITVHEVKGKPYLFGSTVCTPLVRIPAADIGGKKNKVKTKTIYELGMGNGPMSLVVYEKDRKDAMLVSTMRATFKVTQDVLTEKGRGSLNERVAMPQVGRQGRQMTYQHDPKFCETVEGWENVRKMALLDDTRVVVVRVNGGGRLVLSTETLP